MQVIYLYNQQGATILEVMQAARVLSLKSHYSILSSFNYINM